MTNAHANESLAFVPSPLLQCRYTAIVGAALWILARPLHQTLLLVPPLQPRMQPIPRPIMTLITAMSQVISPAPLSRRLPRPLRQQPLQRVTPHRLHRPLRRLALPRLQAWR
jgi:hypothetical protein